MKRDLLIFAITAFFVVNTYFDGKYMAMLKTYKKYYQMAGIAFVGLSAYLFMNKFPQDSRNLLSHTQGLIKYLPIDREAGDLPAPRKPVVHAGEVMLSLISTLGGLLISGLPKLLEFFQNKADQRHELEMMRFDVS